jgi:predicted nucleic acid-binding protein
MILADTSVWIDHLRSENREMRNQLAQGRIVIHPLIIAELALGSLRDRTRTLALLDMLPQVKVAQLHEVRLMIESRRLCGLGVGLIDAELIAAIFINSPTLLWTKDKPLRKVADALGIHANLP